MKKVKAAGLTPDGGVMAKGELPRAQTLNHWTAARQIRFDPERQKPAGVTGGLTLSIPCGNESAPQWLHRIMRFSQWPIPKKLKCRMLKSRRRSRKFRRLVRSV
jgi:hypothetical protein